MSAFNYKNMCNFPESSCASLHLDADHNERVYSDRLLILSKSAIYGSVSEKMKSGYIYKKI